MGTPGRGQRGRRRGPGPSPWGMSASLTLISSLKCSQWTEPWGPVSAFSSHSFRLRHGPSSSAGIAAQGFGCRATYHVWVEREDVSRVGGVMGFPSDSLGSVTPAVCVPSPFYTTSMKSQLCNSMSISSLKSFLSSFQLV